MFAATFTSGYSAQNVRENNFNGDNLLEDTTTRDGLNGTFYGRFAGDGNGAENVTAMGYQTLQNNQGNNNTAVGYSAAFGNRGGSNNTFLGARAGENNTLGNNNMFLGHKSGLDNQSGIWNMFIGNSSGEKIANERYNTIIGHQSCLSSESMTNSIAIGYKNNCIQRYNIVIGNSSTNEALEKSLLIGHNSTVSVDRENVLVWGNDASASASDTVSLGNRNNNYASRSILLGHGIINSNPGACIIKTQENDLAISTSDAAYENALIFNDVFKTSASSHEIKADRFTFSNPRAHATFDSNAISLQINAESNTIVHYFEMNTSNITMRGDTVFESDVDVRGKLVVNALQYDDTFEISKNLIVENDVFFGRALSLSNDLLVRGDATISNDMHVENTLDVHGDAIFLKDVRIAHNLAVEETLTTNALRVTTFDIDAVQINSNVNVKGTSVFEDTSKFLQDVAIYHALDVYSNCDITQSLHVGSNISCDSRITAKNIESLGETHVESLSVQNENVKMDSNVRIKCPLDVDNASAFHAKVDMNDGLDVTGFAHFFSDVDVDAGIRIDNPSSNVDLECINDILVHQKGYFMADINVQGKVDCHDALTAPYVTCTDLRVFDYGAFQGPVSFCNDVLCHSSITTESNVFLKGSVYANVLDIHTFPDDPGLHVKEDASFSKKVTFENDVLISASSQSNAFHVQVDMLCACNLSVNNTLFANKDMLCTGSIQSSNAIVSKDYMSAPNIYIQPQNHTDHVTIKPVISLTTDSFRTQVKADFLAVATFAEDCQFSNVATFHGGIQAPTGATSFFSTANIENLSNQDLECVHAKVKRIDIDGGAEEHDASTICNVNIRESTCSNMFVKIASILDLQCRDLRGSNITVSNLSISDIDCGLLTSSTISNAHNIDTTQIRSHNMESVACDTSNLHVGEHAFIQNLVVRESTHSNAHCSNLYASHMLDAELINARVLSNIDIISATHAQFQDASINANFITPEVHTSNIECDNIDTTTLQASYIMTSNFDASNVSSTSIETEYLQSTSAIFLQGASSNITSSNITGRVGDVDTILCQTIQVENTLHAVKADVSSNLNVHEKLDANEIESTSLRVNDRLTSGTIYVSTSLDFSKEATANLNDNTTYGKIDSSSISSSEIKAQGKLYVQNKYAQFGISYRNEEKLLDVKSSGYYFVPFNTVKDDAGTEGFNQDRFNDYLFNVTQRGVYVIDVYLEYTHAVCTTGFIGILVSRFRNESVDRLDKVKQKKNYKVGEKVVAMTFHIHLEKNENVYILSKYDIDEDADMKYTTDVIDVNASFAACYLSYMIL